MSQLTSKNLPHINIIMRPNPRARRITLRRSARDGGFTVSYPKRLPMREVQEFIDAHEGWLEKHFDPMEAIEYGGTIMYRGEPHVIAPAVKRGVVFSDGAIAVKSTNLGKSIAGALKAKAQTYAMEKVDYYAKAVGSHANEVRWRDPKSRWGSCDTRGNLMFSWRLIMAPDWVFDYVIAHECAHLIHMDHSPRFWKLVSEIYPDYEAAKAYLRREGSKIQKVNFAA